MTLPELIAELEKATEGSRELDLTIWKALHPEAIDAGVWSNAGDRFMSYDTTASIECRNQYARGDTDRFKHTSRLLAYTTSIDAALSLVPERDKHGCLWRVILEQKPLHSGPAWIAEVRPHAEKGGGAIAQTAALALTIAALKARVTP